MNKCKSKYSLQRYKDFPKQQNKTKKISHNNTKTKEYEAIIIHQALDRG